MTKQPSNKRKEIKKENKKENKKVNKKERQKQVKTKKSNKAGKVLILLILILIALVGIFVYKMKQNGGGLQGMISVLVGHDEETLKNLDPIQILLMGISTDNGGKLTDTIVIASYDPQNQKASLLSIPRDTFVGKNPTTGSGYDKINAIYQKGPEYTLEKVNNLTGLDIKYYMVIDNQALIELVDIIGGVDFYVPIDMDYDDTSQDLHIHLKEGMQKLDGDQAEQLLRFRKSNNGTTYPQEYGGDDYGRMRTQREFIIATAKQALQAKNILKIKDIIDLVYEYVETNISIATVKDYVPYAVKFDISTIQSAVIPGASYGPPKYPLWFFIADEKKTEALVAELYGSEEDVSTENETGGESGENNVTSTEDTPITEIDKKETSEINVELLNGSGDAETLTKVKKLLTSKGYKVTKTVTTTSTSKTTIINKTDVDVKFTDNIKELLRTGNVSTSSVSSSNVDITIIIGKDYNK